jgi:hypothetical protein
MSDECWVCKERSQWLNEKINEARADAKKQANEKGKTMAILKEGPIFTIVEAYPGIEAFEVISRYS